MAEGRPKSNKYDPLGGFDPGCRMGICAICSSRFPNCPIKNSERTGPAFRDETHAESFQATFKIAAGHFATFLDADQAGSLHNAPV